MWHAMVWQVLAPDLSSDLSSEMLWYRVLRGWNLWCLQTAKHTHSNMYTLQCHHRDLAEGICGMRKVWNMMTSIQDTYAGLSLVGLDLRAVRLFQTMAAFQFKICQIQTKVFEVWGLDEGLGPPSGASAEVHRSSPTLVFQVTGQDVTNSLNTHTVECVCVVAPLRRKHWRDPVKNSSRVTPLFSRLPSYQTTSLLWSPHNSQRL